MPKARQEEAWDCGLACAHMALRALGVGAHECSLAALRARLPCARARARVRVRVRVRAWVRVRVRVRF